MVLQTVTVSVPAEKALILRGARFFFEEMNLRLLVQSTESFVSTQPRDDDALAVQLTSPSPESAQAVLSIGARNVDAESPAQVNIGDGWWLDLEIV